MSSGVGESYWRYYSKGISLLTIKKTGGKLNRDIGKQFCIHLRIHFTVQQTFTEYLLPARHWAYIYIYI